MAKTHLIADKTIGGIQREYIEVDRKASIGDYVTYEYKGKRDNVVAKVEEIDVEGGVHFEPYTDHCGFDVSGFGPDSYATLEPTEIVQIDGERYKLVERKAEIGEKVVALGYYGGGVELGDILVCTENSEYEDGSIDAKRNLADEDYFFFNTTCDKYIVLDPVTGAKPSYQLDELLAECTPDKRHEESPPYEPDKVFELLANLARRVTSLESQVESLSTQLRDTQRNIETFAQQTEHNSEDIRELDARTQVIGAINSYYGGAR